MNILRIYLLCAVLITAISVSIAQPKRAKGFAYNATQYAEAVKRRDLDVRGLRELPLRLTLRPFCPTPQDQGAESTCAIWAIVHGALTIQQAIHRKVQTATAVDKLAHSKSFVFNQLAKGQTDFIPTVESVFGLLRQRGSCLASTFRNELPVEVQPDELALQEAQSRRLMSVQEVYDPNPSIALARQVQRLKKLLADSVPLVIGVRLPYEFENLTEPTYKYDPQAEIDSSAHALCLIGYDDVDSTFECLNSWGKNWGGDGGFVRFRYRDFFQLLCCAYRFTPQFLVERRAFAPLRGAVVVQRSVGYNADRVPQFEEMRVAYDSSLQCYKLRQGVLSIGSGFQLAVREAPSNWWIYAFHVADDRLVHLLHAATSPPYTVEMTIPKDETSLSMDEEGTAWIGIVYTSTAIPNLPIQLDEWLLQHKNSSVATNIVDFFASKTALKPNYTLHRMGFSVPSSTPVSPICLLLQVTAQ